MSYAPHMDHMQWLKQTTGDAAIRAVGREAKISDRTLGNQIDNGQISAGNVIKIALAYGKNPVTALIDCEYIPAKYATEVDPLTALRQVSEDDLADEVLSRMKLAGDHTAFTTPINELTDANGSVDQPKSRWGRMGPATSGQDSRVRRNKDRNQGHQLGGQ